ncbi:DoxX family protein [Nocardia noduli]|uniref:DoxX family protein n=1 Tax=Nocardia noduli TaxID=2815722 RepID=UPI001C215C1B|nr:hypothetical protein [Nocardia noduli]
MGENIENGPKRSTHRTAFALSALLAAMGVGHFRSPAFFDAIIPTGLPGKPRTYTYVSGAAEIGIAVLLALPRTRGIGGGLAALLFVAVFPANIKMTADALAAPQSSTRWKVRALARLPLQIPLITGALSVSRDARR